MVYVDLDGVLANFQAWADNRLYRTADDPYMELFLRQYDQCFKQLDVIERGRSLLTSLKDPVILTAMPNMDDFIEYALGEGFTSVEAMRRYQIMMANKLTWVASHLGELPVIIVPSRKVKAQFARGNILIDDYEPNIRDWEAAGGTGVLFTA